MESILSTARAVLVKLVNIQAYAILVESKDEQGLTDLISTALSISTYVVTVVCRNHVLDMMMPMLTRYLKVSSSAY